MPRALIVRSRPAREMKSSAKNFGAAPLWFEVLKAIPSLLWAVLAFMVVIEVGPDVWRLVKAGSVTKIGIGMINLELAQKRLAEVRGLDQAGISPAVQKQLKRRFANIAEYAGEAQILWVDDQNPYQNIRERRVLSTLSIPVDLAESTNEAMEWLARANYDIVITDLTRPKDSSSPCGDDPAAAGRAGCDLIKKIMMMPNPPPVIVYARQTEGVLSSKDKLYVTSSPGALLHAVIDVIERMDRKT